jgi:protoporphyrin/coproporphyrin ferrochelatase
MSAAGKPATAVLLVNLGTPQAPTPAAVRRYLAEFLSDARVIDLPRWLWLPILYGVILNVRPRRSAHAYRSIWTERGSPLRVYSEALAGKLDARVRAATSGRARVVLAMRYGEPAIADTIRQLHEQGVRRLMIFPLYPQYSASSTGTVFDAATSALQRLRWPPELRFVGDYHADAGHVGALAQSVRAFWQAHGRAPKLLLSFHGIPERYGRAGDPYGAQCRATAQQLREALQLDDGAFDVSFQSRVGRETWLQPYTEDVLRELPGQGIRHLQVLCPGFAVDCLETLEEIAMRGRDTFLAAGGERLDYIPALNDSAGQVDALFALVRRHAAGWDEFAGADVPASRAAAAP